MVKTLTWECLNKILDNNAEFVFVHLPYLSGKAIEEYTKEHVFVMLVANKKTCVKFAL